MSTEHTMTDGEIRSARRVKRAKDAFMTGGGSLHAQARNLREAEEDYDALVQGDQ